MNKKKLMTALLSSFQTQVRQYVQSQEAARREIVTLAKQKEAALSLQYKSLKALYGEAINGQIQPPNLLNNLSEKPMLDGAIALEKRRSPKAKKKGPVISPQELVAIQETFLAITQATIATSPEGKVTRREIREALQRGQVPLDSFHHWWVADRIRSLVSQGKLVKEGKFLCLPS